MIGYYPRGADPSSLRGGLGSFRVALQPSEVPPPPSLPRWSDDWLLPARRRPLLPPPARHRRAGGGRREYVGRPVSCQSSAPPTQGRWGPLRFAGLALQTAEVLPFRVILLLARNGEGGPGVARIAKAPIVDQPWRGTVRWKEGPGAARIAKALIVYQPQGDERDTQWKERPGRALLAKAPIVCQP
jgi:hypothetical protein